MEECVDGEYQNFKAKGGAYTREHFFGKYPELKAMVANMSDEEIWRLNRGGHDPRKVYAAYAAAMNHKGQPTVILAKTVKGFGLGKGGEGQMVAHQQKKLDEEDLRIFRDRFNIPVSDEDIAGLPFRKPDETAEEMRYLQRAARRARRLPAARAAAPRRRCRSRRSRPSRPSLEGTGEREISTTMAFVRMLTALLKDKNIGKNIVPIVPGRGAHLRHGGPVPPDRHLFLGRAAVHAAGCRDRSCPTARTRRARCSRRASTRPARCARGSPPAPPTQPRHQHGAVLHLLLDVRLPARRRLHLGRRRHAGARLPARRDRRAHDARRRGTAAPGRPQPAGRDHDPELRRLRSDLRLRARGDHPRRHAAHVRRAGERLLLHHRDERELRAAGDAGGRRSRHPQGRATCCTAAAAARCARRCSAPARSCASAGGGADPRERVQACPPTCSRSPASASCGARRSSASAGTCCIRARRARVPYVQQLLRGARRAGRRGHRLHAHRARPDPPVGDRAATWCSAPTAYGRCDARAALRRFFEVDRNHIAVAALKALADDGQVDQATVMQRHQALGIDPDKPVSLESLKPARA